jgi:hypothetical protein
MEKKAIVLEKISDDVFNGNHPNGVNEGMTWKYYGDKKNFKNPEIDKRYHFRYLPTRFLSTSVVTSIQGSIVEKKKEILIFKTENSTYSITTYYK